MLRSIGKHRCQTWSPVQLASVLWSIGPVVKAMDSQSRVPVFKTSCVGSKVDSAFCPSEVNQMSTWNLWELSGRK